ncbi:hypothetical protein M407DRAFT_28498 [Tulasnella calospora MUT 4182]|uniref:Retrotransposon gag domain-containing protein n=1 Tax=Tulasnella calospora MUT 4182 TaxID=1051891 RepID=A0A0C3LKR9_9AGAM|nr:hypothetical protein M407DRAFT_28498 [Tulasnella calospora MUT 4182]
MGADLSEGLGILDENIVFNGTNGTSYQDFIQQIRRIAFSQHRSREFAWMADFAALHFSGDALDWYESLDNEVQKDWDLLRKAMAQKYGDRSTQKETSDSPPSPAGRAPPKKANVPKYPSTSDDYLLPARVEIVNWGTPALVSNIRFPKTEREWLDEARRRKAKYDDGSQVVHWCLVETWERVPGNAIPTGNEAGTNIFSIRAWKDGSLTLGKQAQGGLFWSHVRTY